MRPSEVKQVLKENNLTYRDIGRRWKVTPQMVSDFINHKTKSARLERRLGELIEELKANELVRLERRLAQLREEIDQLLKGKEVSQ